MSGELETILRLVAEGKLAPDEAAPIIEALTERRSPSPEPGREEAPAQAEGRAAGSRRVRIQVSERGRRVVDVRVPLAFAAFAARSVPGMPDRYASLIQEAIDSNVTGPIVDTEDESGDRVLITLE
jgi:hypothetical protein